MREDEKLWRAVAAGLQSVGVDAKYDPYLITQEDKRAHIIVIKHGDLRFQLYVSMARADIWVRRICKGVEEKFNGPDLADPLLFEKLRDQLHRLYPVVDDGRDNASDRG